MKTYFLLLTLVIILLLPYKITGNVAKQSKSSLSERVSFLKETSYKRGVIKMNTFTFKEYVKNQPRNYSFIVMLTAMESHRQCTICEFVYDEFMITVKSFRMSHGVSDKVFFGIVDFDKGAEVFQMLKLNTAPIIMHFPAKRKVKNTDTMDMQRLGFTAEIISRWISDRIDLDFKIVRPPNYFGGLILFLVFFLGSVLIYLRQENLEYFKNKTMWSVVAVMFCLAMTSGQMWNHIRGPPFYHRSGGQTLYIHGSSQGQFVFETYIIFMLNIGFVGCVIGLIETGSSSDNETFRGKKLISLACLIGASFIFSLILSIFRAKAGGYPYRGFL